MIRIRTLFLAVIPFLAVHPDLARAGPDQEPIRFARTPDMAVPRAKLTLGQFQNLVVSAAGLRPALHPGHNKLLI